MIFKPKKYLIIIRGDYIEIKKVKKTYSEFIETTDGECYPLNALTYKLSHGKIYYILNYEELVKQNLNVDLIRMSYKTYRVRDLVSALKSAMISKMQIIQLIILGLFAGWVLRDNVVMLYEKLETLLYENPELAKSILQTTQIAMIIIPIIICIYMIFRKRGR